MTTIDVHGVRSSTARTRPPEPPAAVPAVPFHRLLRVELRKMIDTRAGQWMLAAMAVASVLVVGTLLIWGNTDSFGYADFLNLAMLPMMALLPILGVMAATAEWTQRTGLVTFTLEPRRGRVIVAKVVAAMVLALVVLAAAFAASAIGTMIAGDGLGNANTAVVTGLLAAGLLYTVQGVAFGMLFQNTPIAIVSVLVLPTVWGVLSATVSSLGSISGWLNLDEVTRPLMDGTIAGDDWLRLLTGLAVWIGLPMAIGTYRVLTREVK